MTNALMQVRKRFSSILLLLCICAIPVPVLADLSPGNPSPLVTWGIDTNITNLSFNGEGSVPEYTTTPTPVELFRTELDQETLPGPRYMAFGPSIIGISMDPRLLAVCFAIALIVLVIWFVSFRNRDNEGEE